MNTELLILFMRLFMGESIAYTAALIVGFCLLMSMMTVAVKTFMNRSL